MTLVFHRFATAMILIAALGASVPLRADPASDADALDSYAKQFVTHLWKEPKHRYMTGAIVAGESVLAGILWYRMARNVATWNRQLATVREVSKTLGEATRHYANAERDLARAFAALAEADRSDVLKSLERTDARSRALLEKSFSQRPGAAPSPSALSVEEATGRLEKAYGEWQKQAAAESRVLRAAGSTVGAPASLQEVVANADARTRAVTRLSYASGEFFKFKHEGLKHMAQDARYNLGAGIGWHLRAWRRARTGILLVAIPVVAAGIACYHDKEVERNRRIEDLNLASLQDRASALNTFEPYFGRPLLYAVVKSWRTVQRKEGSALARFRCPYELQPREVDNPHLQVIHGIALQASLDMEKDGQPLGLELEDGKAVLPLDFYRRVFRKILLAEKSPLLQLEDAHLNALIGELAEEGSRSFDRLEDAPFTEPPAETDRPPVGFGR